MSKLTSLIKRSFPFLVFGDSISSVFGHPYALARTGLRSALIKLSPGLPHGPLLDIGCGSMPYKDIFKSSKPYHGLEIDQPRNRENPLVDYFYDGLLLPFDDQSYSVIFSSQVLEHSFEPELFLTECCRVLKSEGSLLLTIPFMWPEHEQPWDSQRFTSYGLIHRLEKSGFSVVSITRVNPGITALLQLLIEWNESNIRFFLCGVPASSLRRLVLLAWRLCWAVPYTLLNLIGITYRCVHSRIQRRKSQAYLPEMFLDLVILAKPKNEILAPANQA